MHSSPPRLLLRFSIIILCLGLAAADLAAQSTLIALPARRDMAFDRSGNFLYISTTDGWVRRYNISTGVIDGGYNLGGSLNGIDVAPDDSFLLVAQNAQGISQGTFHRVQLKTGAVTNINYTRAFGEAGAWDVAIGSNGLALVTTQYAGSGWVPLRQIHLATNEITVRADATGSGSGGMVRQNTQIHRSADGTRFYFLESNSSSGPIFSYSALTNTFGPRVMTDRFLDNASAAVNRTGSLVASRIGSSTSFDAPPNFDFVRSFRGLTSGVAFDAVADRFYAAVAATSEVRAFDTNTFAELYRLQVGESVSPTGQFGTGTLVASNDGRYVAVATPSGIRLLTLPKNAAPPPAATFGTPRDMVFDHAGQYLYITTAEGLVWPYHLASGALGAPYDVGGSLNGADIAPDDSYLLVSQYEGGVAQGAFQKVDLATGAVTNINYVRTSGEGGAWDVAIASNGTAFGTTDYLGSGWIPLRQLALATGSVTVRSDAPGSGGGGRVRNRTHLHRSADRTRLYLLEADISNGPLFTYSATSDSFGPAAQTNFFLSGASAAVNRTGTLLATRLPNSGTSLDTAPNFGHVRSFGRLNSGVAFDAVTDTLYGVSSFTSQVIAYDTNTFAERSRFDIGETVSSGATQFGPGLLVASQDGRHLALQTATAVRVFGVPAVQLLSVASIKSHGGAVYAIDLPLDGPRGVECRSGGASRDYTMVFTFGENLVSVGGAAVISGSGSVSSSMIDAQDPRRYIVNLTGVGNAQTIRVRLHNVLDVAGNHTGLISQQVGMLEGDTNGNGAVNATDVGEVKAQAGQPVSGTNFRMDVNANGGINSSDIGLVKSRAGTQLSVSGRGSSRTE